MCYSEDVFSMGRTCVIVIVRTCVIVIVRTCVIVMERTYVVWEERVCYGGIVCGMVTDLCKSLFFVSRAVLFSDDSKQSL